MPIYQINVYVCERCGKVESTTEEVYIGIDPVVGDLDGTWSYDGNELACPKCRKE